MTILSFQGPYRFLSNFWIEPDGTHVEGEFQWAKAKNPEKRFPIFGMNPWAARKYGNTLELREDWEQIKDEIMFSFVLKKFSDHSSLRRALIETGDAELIEGNNHGDTYWGTVNGVGKNRLGEILMSVREYLTPQRSA